MKASIESGVDSFGWYGSIIEAAGSPDKVPIIGQLPLYDFLLFLSYNSAKNKFEERYAKG